MTATGQTLFQSVCLAHGLSVPLPEFQFAAHRGRKFRWDWAWVPEKVALESQGGIFTRGRHVRGAALLREHVKLNLGAALGWRVLFTTPDKLAAADAELFADLAEAMTWAVVSGGASHDDHSRNVR